MKKFFIALLSLMSISAMATKTAYVGIKLTGKTTEQTTNYKVRLNENTDYTNGFDEGADVELLNLSPSNSSSVFLYAVVGNYKCTSVYDDDLSNLEICLQTNRVDDHYKLTFTSVSGRSLRLYDVVTETWTQIIQDSTYQFEVNADNCPGFVVGQNKLVKGRFYIEPKFADDTLIVCHVGEELQVNKNPYSKHIIVKDVEGKVVRDLPRSVTPQIISLSDLPKGRYTVEFNDGAEKFVISVKPDVTVE